MAWATPAQVPWKKGGKEGKEWLKRLWIRKRAAWWRRGKVKEGVIEEVSVEEVVVEEEGSRRPLLRRVRRAEKRVRRRARRCVGWLEKDVSGDSEGISEEVVFKGGEGERKELGFADEGLRGAGDEEDVG